MTMQELKEFLMWCTLINYGILLVWFGVFAFAPKFIHNVHSRWFKVSEETFHAIHYAGISLYKIGIILLNFVPWIVLLIMTAMLAD